MNIDPDIVSRLNAAHQEHLLTYWSELDHEQRAILIRDITNIDLDHVTQAFHGIKDQLDDKPVHGDLNGDDKSKTIDELMEPIPGQLTGSVDQTTKDQLEHYRREG